MCVAVQVLIGAIVHFRNTQNEIRTIFQLKTDFFLCDLHQSQLR